MPRITSSLAREVIEHELTIRFNNIIEGNEVDDLSTKMIFFEHLETFLNVYPHRKEFDIGTLGDIASQYQYYMYIIQGWCEKKINEIREFMDKEKITFSELGYKTLDSDCIRDWRIFRRQMGIIPTNRGFCSGYIEDGYLEERGVPLRTKGSIIILGERPTLLSKIGDKLNEMGYPTSIISTSGTDISTVSEMIELLTVIDQDRKIGQKVLILYLHDSDITGYNSFLNLQQYTQVYSLGINREFIEYNNIDVDKVKEKYSLPKKTKKTGFARRPKCPILKTSLLRILSLPTKRSM